MTREAAISLLIAAGLLAAPLLGNAFDEPFVITLATKVAILGLAGTGLNLALGYGGMVSLGHAAFFGLGGYAAGILASHALNYEPLFTAPLLIEGTTQMLIIWPVAIVVSGLAALVIGALSLRTSGVFFIMITLAFAQMVYYFAISWPAYGGEDGLPIYIRNEFPGLNTLDPLSFFAICYVLLGLAIAFSFLLSHSRFGLALSGARQNTQRLAHRRHQPLPREAHRLRDLGHDGGARRRALRRPQPLCQPLDALLAYLGRDHGVRDPGRHAAPVRPRRGRRALHRAAAHAGRRERALAAAAGRTPWSGWCCSRAAASSAFWRGSPVMPEPILEIQGLSKRFGAVVASDEVTLDLVPGEIHALIGPNGAGKSTVIKQIAGEVRQDKGSIRFAGRDIGRLDVVARAQLGLARTFQVSSVAPEFSTL